MFSLGTRIREIRLRLGMTQIDLAKEICTPSMISQIESDRARPSYKILYALAERLEVPLEKLLVDVDMNLEYISTYKMARSMVLANEYASAIPLLKELLETPRTQISTMDVMFDLAVCHLHTQNLEEADKLFTQVQELSVLRQDHQMLAQVMLNIGKIEFFRKRYQLAAYQWQKAIEEAEKMEEQDIYLKANLLFNLGLAHVKIGQVHEALAYYRQASVLYENNDSMYEIGKVYMGLGMSYKRLNDLEKAAEYSERAISIFEGLDNQLMAVKLRVMRAVVHGQTGRVEEAIPMLEEAIAKFRDMNKREEEGTSHVELAKLLLERGQLNEAEEACRRARSLLPELHLFHAWIHRILGRLALQRHQREEAIRRFKSAADCFKRMEEINEWDKTMYELVRLYLEHDELQLAFHSLDEIRRYSRQILEERGIVL